LRTLTKFRRMSLIEIESDQSTAVSEKVRSEPAGKGYHESSLASSILNLIKNLIGASMLAMPYGTSISGVIPSIIICLLIGCLSAYTFGMIGVMCGETRSESYRQVCEKILGKRFGILVDAILALYALPCCIGYGIFTCDCMRVMLMELFPGSRDAFYTSRAFIGLVLTLGVLLPLCSMRTLNSLTFTSVLGLGAILYCFIFVATDLAKHSDSISHNLNDTLWRPASGSLLALFPIANIYSSCFLVHYNASKFFYELKNPTPRRVVTMAYVSTFAVVLFCGSFAVLGFARFGTATPGNLLKGYSSAYAVWVATSIAMITTYPFDFDAGRRSLVCMLTGLRPWITQERAFWGTTFVLIPVFSIISVLVDNLSTIVGMNGSLFGITVGFTLPGLLLYRKTQLDLSLGKASSKWGLVVGLLIATFGVLMSALGFVSLFVKFA